jgi:hypothetical protein
MITKEPQSYIRYDCELQDGYEINNLTKQLLKNELLGKFSEAGETKISYFLNVVPAAVLQNMRNTTPTYISMYT